MFIAGQMVEEREQRSGKQRGKCSQLWIREMVNTGTYQFRQEAVVGCGTGDFNDVLQSVGVKGQGLGSRNCMVRCQVYNNKNIDIANIIFFQTNLYILL